MKLILSFVLCFNYTPNVEKHVLEYILSAYAQTFQEQAIKEQEKGSKRKKKKNERGKSKVTEKKLKIKTQHVSAKLNNIFEILKSHNVDNLAIETDIDLEVQKKIARVLGLEDLNSVFLIDESLTRNIAVLRYHLLGQKFQINIQYSGHIAKLYYHNSIKCIKCYIREGKAWVAFIMKHNFGDLSERQIRDLLRRDIEFTLEYNDSVEYKRMVDDTNRYDGYLYPSRYNGDTFALEIEQLLLFKDRPKSKRDTRPSRNANDEKKIVDTWDIPANNSFLSGILDSEQKSKVTHLIETWHQEGKHNIQEEFKHDVPKIKHEEEKQNDFKELIEKRAVSPKTKENEKKKKLGKGKSDYDKSENPSDKNELVVKVNGSNLMTDSEASSCFKVSDLKGYHLGVLLKTIDSIPPSLAEDLQLMHVRLGILNHLPIEVLNKYNVKRIHAIIEFETPFTELQTISQPASTSVDLSFFKMISFNSIVDYQRFFAAFHLKQMLIRVIGEIDKEPKIIKDKLDLQDIFEEHTSHLTKVDSKEVFNCHNLKEDNIIESIPENVIINENETGIHIRLCLFRVDLDNFVRFNHFHRLMEILEPSAVYDKGPEEVILSMLNVEVNEDDWYTDRSEPISRQDDSFSNLKTSKLYSKNHIKQRSYLIGVDYKQNPSLEFDFQIQACFKNLCHEYYTTESNGLNDIFVIFEDKSKLKEMVRAVQEYNKELQAESTGKSYILSKVL